MDILQYIPHGKENAVTRSELCRLTKLPDRCVRQEIEKLRRKGAPILSSSSAKGYWVSDDISEIRAFLKEFDHRINTQNKNMARLRRYCNEVTGVHYTKVREHVRRLDNGNYIDGQIRFTAPI